MTIEENFDLNKICDMYSLESVGINSKDIDNTDELILQEFRSKKSFQDVRIVVSWP